MDAINGKKQMMSVKNPIDPIPSKRAVISESEILHEVCSKCRAPELMPCRRRDRQPLAFELDSTELAFHSERIMAALYTQVTTKLKGVLSAADRSLIVYYSFIMLADACAANSDKLFSKLDTSEELQSFFAQQAITELKKDHLIP
jgi:hypothetical protein